MEEGNRMGLTYAQAIEVLEGALRFGVNPSLDSITAICDALDRPQETFDVIQVAGTNGKSSVAWMAEALLTGQGVKAACYTSPHLSEYTERIRLDGVDCSEDEFAAALEAAVGAADVAGIKEPTEFELLTAAALWLFRERGIEVAVLEVGMGGRWDATSVAVPKAAVVTSVGIDHAEHLGETREEIAGEKAWIVRNGAAAILGPGTNGVEDVFAGRAAEQGSSVANVSADVAAAHEFSLPPEMPSYQAVNAAMGRAAVAACTGTPVEDHAVTAMLAQVRVPARFETLLADPLVIADGSHNPQAARVLGSAIRERFVGAPRIVLSVLDDKDAGGIVDALLPVVRGIVVTASASPRAMAADELAEVVADRVGLPPRVYETLGEALEALSSEMNDGVVITGSLTIAAEARERFLNA